MSSTVSRCFGIVAEVTRVMVVVRTMEGGIGAWGNSKFCRNNRRNGLCRSGMNFEGKGMLFRIAMQLLNKPWVRVTTTSQNQLSFI
jgi:hypothetical protein